MFPGESGVELDIGYLRSGRLFHLVKRRKFVTDIGSYIMIIGEDYELALYFDEYSCDKEEEYQPISKEE